MIIWLPLIGLRAHRPALCACILSVTLIRMGFPPMTVMNRWMSHWVARRISVKFRT